MIATYASSFSFNRKFVLSALQILGASLFIALCAQIRIPLPFGFVPFTCQTFAVMLVGAALGSRKGLFAVLAYLTEGALGLPFFANGCLLSVTGGYLLGFAFQAYLVGWFAERQQKGLSLLLGMCLASAVQLGLGALWLSSFVGPQMAFTIGFYPFILIELAKAVMVTLCLSKKS